MTSHAKGWRGGEVSTPDRQETLNATLRLIRTQAQNPQSRVRGTVSTHCEASTPPPLPPLAAHERRLGSRGVAGGTAGAPAAFGSAIREIPARARLLASVALVSSRLLFLNQGTTYPFHSQDETLTSGNVTPANDVLLTQGVIDQ